MNLLKRTAFWLGTVSSMGVFYLGLALVKAHILPNVFATIATGVAGCAMLATIGYVLVTNSYRKYEEQNNRQPKELA